MSFEISSLKPQLIGSAFEEAIMNPLMAYLCGIAESTV